MEYMAIFFSTPPILVNLNCRTLGCWDSLISFLLPTLVNPNCRMLGPLVLNPPLSWTMECLDVEIHQFFYPPYPHQSELQCPIPLSIWTVAWHPPYSLDSIDGESLLASVLVSPNFLEVPSSYALVVFSSNFFWDSMLTQGCNWPW